MYVEPFYSVEVWAFLVKLLNVHDLLDGAKGV